MDEHTVQSRLAIRSLGTYVGSYLLGLVSFAIVRADVAHSSRSLATAFAVAIALLVQFVALLLGVALLVRIRGRDRHVPRRIVRLVAVAMALTLAGLAASVVVR